MKITLNSTSLFFIIPFIVLTASFSCEETDCPEKAKCILVYADLTGSMDQFGVDQVSEKAQAIWLSLEAESRMVVKLIDDNDWGAAVFDHTLPSIESGFRKDLELLKEHRDSLGKVLQDTLQSLFTASRADTHGKGRYSSCIMNSFPSIIQFFNDQDTCYNDFELVIISDMVEECNAEQTHIQQDVLMYASRSSPKPDTTILGPRIRDGFSLTKQLKPFVSPDKFYCVITTNSSYIGDRKCLQTPDITAMWKIIFDKLGYSKEEVSRIHFSGELPPEFTTIPE